MKTARPDFGRADQRDEKRLLGYRNSSQRKTPFVNFIERNFAAESKSGFNKIPTWSKMYGLNIAQRGGVSQIYPPYCALPYRANGQNCPLLKNE